MKKTAAVLVAAGAMVLAGCSSGTDTATSPPASNGTEATENVAANTATYAIKATGSVTMSGITAPITGGSITGATGTINIKILGVTQTAELTGVSVSPTAVTATVSLDSKSGTGTLDGKDYVYSGTVTGSETIDVKDLTLSPTEGDVDENANSFAVEKVGSVTMSGDKATIEGGSIADGKGTLNLKYLVSITADVTNAKVSPSSVSATVTVYGKTSSGTLKGSNYVYSGTLKSSTGDVVTVSDLTLKPTSKQ